MHPAPNTSAVTASHHHAQVPPLGSFLAGRPEARIGATGTPSVLIAWLHADEELAPRVAHYIYTQRPDLARHVDYICGNPRAAASVPTVGFCETDLNRSFQPAHQPASYEELRALEILDLAHKYDYVLDLHTAVSPEMGDSIFTAQEMFDKPAVRDLIAAAPNRRILVVPTPVARTSLLGATSNTLTLEYSATIAKERGIADVISTIERLIGTSPAVPKEREVYFIDGAIPKSEDPGPMARNFEFWESGGYYPILLGTGPRSYREDPTKDYCCFYSKRKELLVI
jgi:hypothetical protein